MQRELRLHVPPFPHIRARASERPGAVKGAPQGAAQRPLDGEDRSAMIDEEGKERCGLDSISEASGCGFLKLTGVQRLGGIVAAGMAQ